MIYNVCSFANKKSIFLGYYLSLSRQKIENYIYYYVHNSIYVKINILVLERTPNKKRA